MIQVTSDGSYVVFRLPHSEEEFRLTAAEAINLGESLFKKGLGTQELNDQRSGEKTR